jgi:hypothetical protein
MSYFRSVLLESLEERERRRNEVTILSYHFSCRRMKLLEIYLVSRFGCSQNFRFCQPPCLLVLTKFLYEASFM